ncbi:hypothetical protein DTW90_04575 [Neorhizobium sp. P12A]|nr:hypothetical protein DTW90_04575 [Neorhizobium sp. P12A]
MIFLLTGDAPSRCGTHFALNVTALQVFAKITARNQYMDSASTRLGMSPPRLELGSQPSMVHGLVI